MPEILLSIEQYRIVLDAIELVRGRLNVMTHGLHDQLGRLTTLPKAVVEANDSIKSLSEYIEAKQPPMMMPMQHAKMLKAVIQANRRKVAEEVELKRQHATSP